MDFLNYNLLPKEKSEILRNAGLHKVAAVLEKLSSGREVSEINLPTAIALIGEKAFIKNAEQRRIFSGIEAFKKLKG